MSTPIFSPTRTEEEFTTGLVNLPIVIIDGVPLKHLDKRTGRMKYDVVPNMVYPLFELDTKDEKNFNRVRKAYESLRLPFYWHNTMRGFHFISNVALSKESYGKWITPLMKLNPKCPMVTLRIRANKWVNEDKVFFDGAIATNGAGDFAISQLEELKTLIERQTFSIIEKKFYLVNYRMTGEMGNL